MPENKSAVSLVEGRKRKGTEAACSQRARASRHPGGLLSPWNVGNRKPQAWPAQRRGFINKRAQLLPSFMYFLCSLPPLVPAEFPGT